MRTVRNTLTAVALAAVAHTPMSVDPVLRGREGNGQQLPYMRDPIYDPTAAKRTLLVTDFPSGEHIKAVAQSTAAVFHVRRTGDTLQVSANRPGEKMGLNVTTPRGSYHRQMASIADAWAAAHIVHFVMPSAYQPAEGVT